MKKKLLILFGLFSLITIINTISCTKCEGGGTKKVIDIRAVMTGAQYSPQDPNKMMYFDITNDTIYYSFLGIIIQPEMTTASNLNTYNSFGFINAAYACDPVIPTTNDKITQIEIVADQDYNDSHPKGSDLAEYFDVVVTYAHTNTYDEKYDLKEYLGRKPLVPDEMTLILKTKPKQDTKFVFTLNYKQDGVSFSSKKIVFDPVTVTQ